MKYLFCILFIFLAQLFWGQNESEYIAKDYAVEKKEFDKEEWQRISKELNYPGPERRNGERGEGELGEFRLDSIKEKGDGNGEYGDEDERRRLRPISRSPKPTLPSINFQGIMLIIFIGLIVALLVWLLRNAKYKGNKKVKQEFSVKEFLRAEGEDENLEVIDEYLLAKQNGDYRLAIRYLYLKLIITLSTKGDIEWKKDKTNYEYLYELKSKNKPSEDFLFFTQVYEHTWFGLKKINLTDFEEIERRYHTYQESLSPNTTKQKETGKESI